MFKNRIILMLLTGIGLALILWLLALAFQSGPDPQPQPQISDIIQNPQSDTAAKPEETAPNLPETEAEIYSGAPEFLSANYTADVLDLTGRGAAGSSLNLMYGDDVLMTAKVSEQGVWQAQLPFVFSGEAAVLDILMTAPDGLQIRSDQDIIIVPSQISDPFEADVSENAAPPLVLLTQPGSASRVLQSPFGALPQQNGFVLEAIDYDNAGGVIFSGTSNLQGRVYLFASSNSVGDSRTGPDGRWSLIFGNIMPLGSYTITAQFLPDDGSKPRRIDLPFTRLSPDDFAGPDSQNGSSAAGVKSVSLKRDIDTLQISRALYGGGYQYTIIYGQDAVITLPAKP